MAVMVMVETKLLIVDDEQIICEALAEIFHEKGYSVATATTGREALDKVKQIAFNVALIDIKLPDMDGTTLLKKLKMGYPGMVCIIITGYASVQNAIKALEEGASGYFVKPLVIEEVIHRVEEALETQRLQQKLKESEERLSSFMDSATDGFALYDSELNLVEMNKAALAMFPQGTTKEEVIGKNIFEIAPGLKETGKYDQYLQVLKTGKPFFVDEFVLHPEFGDRDLNVKAFKVGDGLGIITTDITARKRTEEERERLLKELEAKNRELGHFTYTVSHDLRSPLVTVQGFVDIVQEDLKRNEVEKAKDNLTFIENAATKMDRLLRDTLQLSRIGRITNPPEEVPFGEIVAEALEQTAEQIKSSGVEISVAEDFPTVHVDRMRIVEVLVNLITNSINYRGEESTPKIEVGHRDAGEESVLFVQDNGIGIDPSQHEKVFDLFYQVNTSGRGTGAGLAIVKRIIEVHSGRIWIESEKGKGCTVCFTLPVV
jgi:PAS domain S-box-containing protein